MKSLLLLIAVAVTALFAVAAEAQSPAALRHSSAKLLACDPVKHEASFQGAMSAFGRARGLEMKLVLQARRLGRGDRFARIGAPGFESWLRADPGTARYVFDKTVANLPLGASYRLRFRFRWRDAAGEVVARATRRTRQCRQPDTRANLEVTRLRPAGFNGDGTRAYVVTVENTGGTDAPASQLALDVNGMRYLFPAAAVAAGDTVYETFTGPACSPVSSVSATADAGRTVDERDENDNVVTVGCGS